MTLSRLQWWILGTAPYEHEAHRSIYLAKAWAEEDEVLYIHPTSLNDLFWAWVNPHLKQLPDDYGTWITVHTRLRHTSRIGYYLPSYVRWWRVTGSWWGNEWPFGLWLKRQMIRQRQQNVGQILVSFCWGLSWSLRATPTDLMLYDCSDNFRAYPYENSSRMDWAERRLARMADGVVVSSMGFKERMSSYNDRVMHIPNGVTVELLQSINPVVQAQSNKAVARPVVIYHGATQAWRFNWELYVAVARQCTQYDFVIYTDPKHVPVGVLMPDNVKILKWIPPSEVASMLAGCAAAFMPYRLSEPTLSCFPLKLFEYLAAGLPVVSTRLTEVRRFGHVVALCDDTPQEIVRLIDYGISSDSPELRKMRRAFAEQYSWRQLAQQYREHVLASLGDREL